MSKSNFDWLLKMSVESVFPLSVPFASCCQEAASLMVVQGTSPFMEFAAFVLLAYVKTH